MVECQFTAKYWDYERKEEVDYICDSIDEDVLDSGLCILHEKKYLEGYAFHRNPFSSEVAKREERVSKMLGDKINHSKGYKKPLFCIGYYFPTNTTIKGNFVKPVYFSHSKFQNIDFSLA